MVVLAGLPLAGFSQCNSIAVIAPGTSCIGGSFDVRTTTVADFYEWDFCTGDLMGTPQASLVRAAGVVGPFDLAVVQDQGKWHSFVVGYTSNTISRIDYGTDLRNPSPAEVNLGNLGSLLSNPTSIKVIKQGTNWFAVVYNQQNSRLLLVSFGASLENSSPGAVTIATGIGGIEGALDIAHLGGNSFVILVSESSGTVTSIPFPNGLDQAPGAPNIVNVGGYIVDIEIVDNCTSWSAFGLRLGTKNLVRLDYGTDLTSVPVIVGYPANQFNFSPYRLWIEKEGDYLFGLASSLTGGVASIDIGLNPATPTPVIIDHGNLGGVLSSTWTIFAAKQSDRWTGFTLDGSNSNMYALLFPNNPCGSSSIFSTNQNPGLISYATAGQKFPSIRITYATGVSESKSFPVLVQNLPAPPLQIDAGTNQCVSAPFNFAPVSSATLTGIGWDFGDGATSTSTNPSHVYAASGTYPVKLIASEGSCSNTVIRNVPVYNPPSADFLLPAPSPVCTNQSYQFLNSTLKDPGSLPTYVWNVEGVDVSTTADLDHAFVSTGSKQVTLTASLPGCFTQITKNFGVLQQGAVVDFSFTDQCLGTSVSFINLSIGPGITGYTWTFGDGNGSVLVNPQNNYSSIGLYSVALSVSNAAGCNNSVSKPVHIWSVPQPDFSVGLPPFSCSNSPTPFQNDTPPLPDSNITGWSWMFGDPGSSSSSLQAPAFAYTSAGNYLVNLTATSEFGCQGSKVKSITIGASPSANFSVGPSCLNLPTVFTDTSSGGVQSRIWQIGAATYTTTNPSHTFTAPGNYTATLTATSPGGCSNVQLRTINVPAPPVLSYATTNQCAGKESLFTDGTSSPIDPITGWNWNFAGNAVTGNPAPFVFSTPGVHNAKMTTTHASGCKYTLSKNITINPTPTANFSASPDRGAPPLTVQFINTSSVTATQFLWTFNDKIAAYSTRPSPVYTFTALGDYQVQLSAANSFGCADTRTLNISVLVPAVDLALSDFSLTTDPATGKLKAVVTVLNTGNIPAGLVEVSLFLANKAVVNETLSLNINPGQSATRTLSFSVSPSQFDFNFLCVEVNAEKDVKPDNNRRCISFDENDYLVPPYPNPNKGTLQIDWIGKKAGSVRVVVFNSMGGKVYEWESASIVGLNQSVHDLEFLSSGLYYVTVQTSAGQQTTRFLRQ